MNNIGLRCEGRVKCSSTVVNVCKCGMKVVLLCEECISGHIVSPGNHKLIRTNIKMNDFGLRCEGKVECSYPVVNACNCGMKVVLLCEECKSDHVLSPGEHQLIWTNKTQQIQAESIEKQELKSDPIQTHTNPIHEHIYNTSNIEEAKSTPRVTNIHHSRSFTYNLKFATKKLVKYDSVSDTITKYTLPSLPYKLSNASTCILPDDSVIIAGGFFYDSKFSQVDQRGTYRVTFDTHPPTLTQLGDLNTARHSCKLVVHGDYVYAFGGSNIASCNVYIAERMKILEWRWTQLPNMKKTRSESGLYLTENRIYLIGGLINSTIEYYDIQCNNFYILPNVKVPKEGIVCGVIGDLIYAIGYRCLRVFNKDFQLLESRNNVDILHSQCFSDVIVRESSFIFINNNVSLVFLFDSKTRSIRIIKQF